MMAALAGRRLSVSIALVILTSSIATLSGASAATAQTCPNEQLRAENGSLMLPDCRAYELVSPAVKDGYSVGNDEGIPNVDLGSSASGEDVSYTGINPLPGAEAGSFGGFVAERTSTEWENRSILPPPGTSQIGLGEPGDDGAVQLTTPDQLTSVFWDESTSPWGALGIREADGSLRQIATAVGLLEGLSFCGDLHDGGCRGEEWAAGISANGRHVVFTSTNALVSGLSATGADILYEWSNEGSESIRVVNRTNSPTLTLIGSSNAELGDSGSETETSRRESYIGLRHAISADGSRIFFQSPGAILGGGGGGPLYLREDADRTVEVSAPAPGYTPSNPPTTVAYLDASASGSIVYFWANGDLVQGAPSEGGIYSYEVERERLNFVAEAPAVNGNGEPEPLPDGKPPTAIASEDGSHLYYEDGRSIYLHTEDGNQLVLADAVPPVYHRGNPEETPAPWFRDEGCPSADVSPDGQYFTFLANVKEETNLLGTIYRYDAQNGELTEIASDATFISREGCGITGRARPIEKRVMSTNGEYVFFTTPVSLVSGADNNQNNVYEWHTGQIALISGGSGSTGSTLLGTDATGANVFFGTAEALVPEDGDSDADIYDARVDGGFPAQSTASCTGEGCQGNASTSPSFPTPASAMVSGNGNLTSTLQPKKQQKAHKKKSKAHKKHKSKRTATKKTRKATHGRKRAKRRQMPPKPAGAKGKTHTAIHGRSARASKAHESTGGDR